MAPVFIFVLLNALAGVAFLIGRVSSRQRGPRPALLATVLVAGLLGLKLLFFLHPAREAQFFPYAAYAYFQNFFYFPALLLALGLLIPRLPRRWNPRLMFLLALALFGLGLCASANILRPVQGADIFPDVHHHCIQSTPLTCAPAACATALSYLKLPTTERTMADLCLTTRGGTSDFGIFRGLSLALQNTPYQARLAEATPDDLLRPGTLAIITIRSHTHAICTLGAGSCVIVHNPLEMAGEVWPDETLRAQYAGVATLIERRPECPPR